MAPVLGAAAQARPAGEGGSRRQRRLKRRASGARRRLLREETGRGVSGGAGRLKAPPRPAHREQRRPRARWEDPRPPRLRPATPEQVPGGGDDGARARAAGGQSPVPFTIPRASSRGVGTAGGRLGLAGQSHTHRRLPSPLSRTGPTGAVSQLRPSSAARAAAGRRDERCPPGPPAKPSYLGGLPGEGRNATPGRFTPTVAAAAAAGPLSALSGGGAGAGLPADWPAGSDGQPAVPPRLWPRRAGPPAAPATAGPTSVPPLRPALQGPVIQRAPRPEHLLQGL